MPQNSALKTRPELVTIGIVSLSLVALLACVAITWLKLSQTSYATVVQAEIQTQQTALQQQAVHNKLPTLILNQDNTQEGPVVVVNPQNLGKPNPFIPQ